MLFRSDLNNPTRVVAVRFEVGESIQESLQSALDILSMFKNKSATRTKNRLLSAVRGILTECQPTSAYAATAASVLHSDPTYANLVSEMNLLGLWDLEFDDLHKSSLAIAL